MLQFNPNTLFNDFCGTAGTLTVYHGDGKCYIRKRSAPDFPSTPAQQAALSVHRRVSAAVTAFTDLKIHLRLSMPQEPTPERYALLCKVQHLSKGDFSFLKLVI